MPSSTPAYVCLWSLADVNRCPSLGRLLTQSGHSQECGPLAKAGQRPELSSQRWMDVILSPLPAVMRKGNPTEGNPNGFGSGQAQTRRRYMADYSRLMRAADEAGTLARLEEYRRELIDPKNKQYRGRVVKATGDGILIEFPSVVDAISCSLEFSRACANAMPISPPEKRIEFRIVINLGDVIVEGRDLYGDGSRHCGAIRGASRARWHFRPIADRPQSRTRQDRL